MHLHTLLGVSRSPSSILFGMILCLSLALVLWWTLFQARASRELEAAGAELAAGNIAGTAAAFGVSSGAEVQKLGQSRFWMFVSEGAVFVIVLIISGWLFRSSKRNENTLRTSQDRFLAGATHELKTPLATITLLLESLRDNRLAPEKRSHYLRMGLLEADRLERGLTNVLVAAGLRTAKAPGPRTEGDLGDDIRSVVTALEPRAAAARVNVSSIISEPVSTLRDPEAIQLILHNLLENAIKHSPPETKVEVELTADETMARIVVRDQGRGLDSQELAHAFEPFWRGSDGVTGGSGLGLHLVRQLIEAHGGSVEAKSNGRDEGAVFAVNLPRSGAAR